VGWGNDRETDMSYSHNVTSVGTIGNHYGGLNIKKVKGQCYWSIENWDGNHWEEIPQYLYDAILKFEFTPPDWL
jgi:hypothetical protein